jgi:hypothetical protein
MRRWRTWGDEPGAAALLLVILVVFVTLGL